MPAEHFYDLLYGIGGFSVVLALLVGLRIKSKERFEIKSPDIVLALIPVAMWLLLTGRVTKFEYGDLKIETAFINASDRPVKNEVVGVHSLPVERIVPDAKRGAEAIPELIRKKSKALSFTLGQGSYVGTTIEDYLVQLTTAPYLRYVIVHNPDGTFWGMSDARAMAEMLSRRQLHGQAVADWLNQAKGSRLQDALPGFVPADRAVTTTASRREVLARMSELDVEMLPVVDAKGAFEGIIERSRLSASMLVDIAKGLEE